MNLKEALFKKNVGDTDRRIRMSIGAVLFSGGVFVGHTLMGVIGLLVFISGLRGNCPLYSLKNHSTLEEKDKKD